MDLIAHFIEHAFPSDGLLAVATYNTELEVLFGFDNTYSRTEQANLITNIPVSTRSSFTKRAVNDATTLVWAPYLATFPKAGRIRETIILTDGRGSVKSENLCQDGVSQVSDYYDNNSNHFYISSSRKCCLPQK